MSLICAALLHQVCSQFAQLPMSDSVAVVLQISFAGSFDELEELDFQGAFFLFS